MAWLLCFSLCQSTSSHHIIITNRSWHLFPLVLLPLTRERKRNMRHVPVTFSWRQGADCMLYLHQCYFLPMHDTSLRKMKREKKLCQRGGGWSCMHNIIIKRGSAPSLVWPPSGWCMRVFILMHRLDSYGNMTETHNEKQWKASTTKIAKQWLVCCCDYC